ncbi:NAD(P)H-binding protein [Tessaracoccus sp. MC1627]|uniref:NAD(P)-dependent oxidoreductase n=1 Tax=Tessaracoccus sp. MC1627 TaxID=2760312 RepID=UPI0016020525|nr:NAD(P)H-binding protein [Tessaracoccus sp. MC1627]MBB1513868.1 NAD(P)H-binding protein [Tessaracoccus sp. MC1627]
MDVIALFGATGGTGRRVLDRLLAEGYGVRVLVRDKSKLGEVDPRVHVVVGDVLDPEAVGAAVEASSAVLGVFGQVKGSPRTLQTDGTRAIVEAMQRHGVTRLVTLSGGGLRAEQDQPRLADRAFRGLLKLMAGHVLADAEGHLAVLQGSGLDWTVVRGPRLTDQPGLGRYRVGWVGVDGSTQISRDDLADFIVSQVADRRFVGLMPFVSR